MPTVVEPPDRRYVGIHAVVTMATIDSDIPELIRELLANPEIVATNGEAPIVPHDVIDRERELAIQVGVRTPPGMTAETPGDGPWSAESFRRAPSRRSRRSNLADPA